jgi:EF-P beta-lysylation protein EpmB
MGSKLKAGIIPAAFRGSHYNALMLPTVPLTALPSWQEQLADLITDPVELLQLLQIDAVRAGYDPAALRNFPLRVTRCYAARMQVGNADDPLLRQVLPHRLELQSDASLHTDPLAEQQALVAPGILHKYQGRVLLIATQNCAIHCRYCFRRHFPYQQNRLSRDEWRRSLTYVAGDSSIDEVILSGGDPLALGNAYLASLLGLLEEIPHVRRARIHTRLPVVLPDRIDEGLLQLLTRTRLQVVLVVHANHAQEFDAAVVSACQRLGTAGVYLLNQSVLLAGINDDADTLSDLSEQLFAAGVLPYYLHLPDRVAGTGHFAVSATAAAALHADLQGRLPGYLVPKLVREDAGATSKTWI